MTLSSLDDVYRDRVILDHCRHPRNQGQLGRADISADGVNPFCGDEVHLRIALDIGGKVKEVGYQGVGCAINQASGSILSEVIKGRDVYDIQVLIESFERAMLAEQTASDEIVGTMGQAGALMRVREFPIRIKCVLLGWVAVREGITGFLCK